MGSLCRGPTACRPRRLLGVGVDDRGRRLFGGRDDLLVLFHDRHRGTRRRRGVGARGVGDPRRRRRRRRRLEDAHGLVGVDTLDGVDTYLFDLRAVGDARRLVRRRLAGRRATGGRRSRLAGQADETLVATIGRAVLGEASVVADTEHALASLAVEPERGELAVALLHVVQGSDGETPDRQSFASVDVPVPQRVADHQVIHELQAQEQRVDALCGPGHGLDDAGVAFREEVASHATVLRELDEFPEARVDVADGGAILVDHDRREALDVHQEDGGVATILRQHFVQHLARRLARERGRHRVAPQQVAGRQRVRDELVARHAGLNRDDGVSAHRERVAEGRNHESRERDREDRDTRQCGKGVAQPADPDEGQQTEREGHPEHPVEQPGRRPEHHRCDVKGDREENEPDARPPHRQGHDGHSDGDGHEQPDVPHGGQGRQPADPVDHSVSFFLLVEILVAAALAAAVVFFATPTIGVAMLLLPLSVCQNFFLPTRHSSWSVAAASSMSCTASASVFSCWRDAQKVS